MDENKITQQLNTEIEKLKEQDYTSYQNFYNQTSKHLYGIIWSNVQDQNIANSLLNELYTEIYSSIGTELKDNSQFYIWADNKAKTLSTTYLTTHGSSDTQSSDNERRADGAAVATAMNSGMNMAGAAVSSGMNDGVLHAADVGAVTGGAANVGMGSATGGVANIGMNSGANGVGQAGISMSSSAPVQTGMGTVANGIGQSGAGTAQTGIGAVANGIGQSGAGTAQTGIGAVANGIGQSGVAAAADTIGTGSVAGAGGLAGAGLASGAAHVGLSLGAKLAIGLATVALTVGAGIGVHALVTSNNDKKTEDTTEVVTELGDPVTDDVTEENTEEITTEQTADTTAIDRATAYYNMLVDADGVMSVKEGDGYGPATDMAYYNVRLVDFNGDGNKQLVVVDDETSENSIHLLHVYDYIDGQVVPILEVDYTNTDYNNSAAAIFASYVDLVYASDGTASLVVYDPDEEGADVEHDIRKYVYEDGTMIIEANQFEYWNVDGYSYERLAEHGATPSTAAFANYGDYTDNLDKSENKIEYDKVLEELVCTAGIDTSSVWKTVYMREIQRLREDFYSNDYSGSQNEGAKYKFALNDINGDEIPELIGVFDGWDGGEHFILTCSKYGTFDYTILNRGISISIDENYLNTTDGYVRTILFEPGMEPDSMDKVADEVFKITRGTVLSVGKKAGGWSYDYNEYSFEWLWSGYSETEITYLESISESEFEENANACNANQDLKGAFSYVESVDEIEGIIQNY